MCRPGKKLGHRCPRGFQAILSFQVCAPAVAKVVAPVPVSHGYGRRAYGYGGGHHHYGYGGSARGYYSRGRYGRSAEPSGYGPKCTQVKETVCKKVPVKVPEYVEVPKCQKVPSTQCTPTYRTVLDTECQDIPEEKCRQVPIQVAVEVPFEVNDSIRPLITETRSSFFRLTL